VKSFALSVGLIAMASCVPLLRLPRARTSLQKLAAALELFLSDPHAVNMSVVQTAAMAILYMVSPEEWPDGCAQYQATSACTRSDRARVSRMFRDAAAVARITGR
jgi:hypothetical protein